VLEKTGDKWLPEDVYAAIKAGAAHFYEATNGSGFMIVERQVIWGEPVCHCWIVNHRGEGGIAPYWPEVMNIARQMGCHAITIESPRGGYDRILPVSCVNKTYRMDLTDE
jgi:hypothetical protein